MLPKLSKFQNLKKNFKDAVFKFFVVKFHNFIWSINHTVSNWKWGRWKFVWVYYHWKQLENITFCKALSKNYLLCFYSSVFLWHLNCYVCMIVLVLIYRQNMYEGNREKITSVTFWQIPFLCLIWKRSIFFLSLQVYLTYTHSKTYMALWALYTNKSLK